MRDDLLDETSKARAPEDPLPPAMASGSGSPWSSPANEAPPGAHRHFEATLSPDGRWRLETPPADAAPRPRWRRHLTLYLATWLTTFLVGFLFSGAGGGFIYCAAIMTILTAHELGHYLQARRYGVPASPPYFIPMPLPPFGTLGAVIAMRPQRAHARALFDLAITGPLAGLVPTIVFSVWGLKLSTVVEVTEEFRQSSFTLGEPLIFRLMSQLVVGPVAEGHSVLLHPMGYAGWVGIFITALNLIPIGQSDGGHILYTLMPRHAHRISLAVFAAASAAVVIAGLWNYLFLVILLFLVLLIFGFRHPPMADDGVRLDRWRVALGWLTLTFMFVGLSARPIS